MIANVNIPASVTTIGEKAFYFCKSLKTITVPAGVTSIGNRAFTSCASLTSIEVAAGNANYKSVDGNLYTKDGKTILAYAIGKTADTFVIPSDVTVIGPESFSRSQNLVAITIPSGVTRIEDNAFFYSRLKAIIIPDTVTFVGASAFADCDSIKTVYIGSGVTEMDKNAFFNCTAITSYDVNENNTLFKSIDGNLYTKDGKTFLAYAAGKANDTLVIPEGVTSIDDKAFTTCYYLEKVVLPASLTYIGSEAFKNCSLLEEVTFTKTTGWFIATDKDAASGTSIDVSDVLINANNIKNKFTNFFWKNV
jgi:hypothetical protein